MKTAAQTTFAERLGRTLGPAWRGCVRLDCRANAWLLAQGCAPGFAKTVLLLIKLAALGVLAYAALWLTALLVLAVTTAWVAAQKATEDDSDFLGRETDTRDHKQGLFYHPASYDDDPDPRFEDD
ncbi:hypothetical protein N234_16265 [Ralstonia pickettii DTP0602]|nr:hypothetical protein N234_16265 [Ralstonia pickettii DTP0602]